VYFEDCIVKLKKSNSLLFRLPRNSSWSPWSSPKSYRFFLGGKYGRKSIKWRSAGTIPAKPQSSKLQCQSPPPKWGSKQKGKSPWHIPVAMWLRDCFNFFRAGESIQGQKGIRSLTSQTDILISANVMCTGLISSSCVVGNMDAPNEDFFDVFSINEQKQFPSRTVRSIQLTRKLSFLKKRLKQSPPVDIMCEHCVP